MPPSGREWVPSEPSDEGLVANVVRFARALRAGGVKVPFASVMGAVESLALIDICAVETFRAALRAHFVSRKEDLETFEELFEAFWLGRRGASYPAEEDTAPGPDRWGQETPSGVGYALWSRDTAEKGDSQEGHLRYSHHAAWGLRDGLSGLEASQPLYEAIKKFLQPLTQSQSRRWRRARKGRTISLGRILRKNMQFGGELILLEFQRRRTRRRRVIFLCDVSGSMDLYTLMALQFAHALRRVDRRAEIFFFSTDLTYASPLLDRGDVLTTLADLPREVGHWGGGTRIGHSLEIFQRLYGRRLLSRKAVVIIFSDGWDRGDLDLLSEQMAFLHDRAHRVIWLNPLAGSRGYQPICSGMQAALPYVDMLLPASSLRDFEVLARTLRGLMQ